MCLIYVVTPGGSLLFSMHSFDPFVNSSLLPCGNLARAVNALKQLNLGMLNECEKGHIKKHQIHICTEV